MTKTHKAEIRNGNNSIGRKLKLGLPRSTVRLMVFLTPYDKNKHDEYCYSNLFLFFHFYYLIVYEDILYAHIAPWNTT